MDNKYMLCILTTGQEILAELVERKTEGLVVKQPLSIVTVQQNSDTYGLAFVPYSPAVPEGEHMIYDRAVMSYCTSIPDNLIKAYIQRTTGIEVASSSSLQILKG